MGGEIVKVFVENYNGVFDTIEDKLDESDEITDNPREADVFLLWQDVRGVPHSLAKIAKDQLKKPVIVMQHGRGAVRDYGPPNNFGLIADKILVWGEAEKKRLLSYGIAESRISIVGCPLIQRLKPKVKREGKNILFVPVIAQKEEPENVLVHAVLKIWEQEKLIENIYKNLHGMKKAWAWEENHMRTVILPDGTKENRLWKKELRNTLPRWVTYSGGLINVKLSGVHDMHQYQSPLIMTGQNDPNLIDGIVDLLANIDAMVCLEEGTMQMLAAAMDIPVIVADIFEYRNYGGCENYDKVEKIRTPSCYWTKDINKIGRLLDAALKNPMELSKQRKIVLEQEAGVGLGDATANIINELRTAVNPKVAVTA